VAGRRSTEISSRKAEILSAAAELFAKQGFAGTSVRDIANACGILSGSIYHHFSAKEDLVEEIFTAYFDELTDRWVVVLAEPWDARTKLEAMLRAAIENVDRHTAAARLFTHEWLDLRHVGDFEKRWEEIEAMWLRLLRAGERDGSFRSDIDPALLFSVAMDVIRGLSGWYHQGHRYPIDTLSDAYIAVLMTGVVAETPRTRRPARLTGAAKAPRTVKATKKATPTKSPGTKRATTTKRAAASNPARTTSAKAIKATRSPSGIKRVAAKR
jgi:TetR/AcrR family transcriptional regulator, cholesterol catabolism regulator